MNGPEAIQRFNTLDEKLPVEAYNFEHFRTIHLLRDGKRTLTNRGIEPGVEAPDFELQRVGGSSLRLSDLRGKPTLLHFGSYS
ncbi:MAG: redoxin domain-containing protein [Chloroflexota bacterium]|nr:redoxin domain-containing protein [Chloroflexota bacterium]